MMNAIARRCLACALYIRHASSRTPDSGFMAVMVQRKPLRWGMGEGTIADPYRGFPLRKATFVTPLRPRPQLAHGPLPGVRTAGVRAGMFPGPFGIIIFDPDHDVCGLHQARSGYDARVMGGQDARPV